MDLLRLARTTKALRAILMNRSSSSLWKRVRRTYYEMPDGPEGMPEPQYASLALEHICDVSFISMTNFFQLTIWILGLWTLVSFQQREYFLERPAEELS